VAPDRVFDGSRLREPAVVAALAALRPEIGVSVLFGYRIPPDVLAIFPSDCVNVHPAYLPFNRGAYPNVWSIVDRTPAGVTIHFVDDGLDTGDIVAQRRVAVEPTDTGETLYRRLEEASLALFRETWPLIRSGGAPRTAQQPDAGTFHRVRDVARIDEIDLDASYNARSLLDVLRARTFGSFDGAYFRDGKHKVYVTVHLRESEEGGDGN
jgi:methionyl-tRNA formyltransferase